jgi:uncharacterized membrane protein
MSADSLQTSTAATTRFSFGDIKPTSLVVLASIIVLLPACYYGIPSNRDLLNHFRFALPFYDALRAGNLHPGWLAESNQGLGDPSFRFYPPALYYLLSIARVCTGDWYVATLATFAAISVAGGLGIYLWARCLIPQSGAVCAAVLFALTPYHLNQYYQAVMLAEYAGLAVLPFAFLFI